MPVGRDHRGALLRMLVVGGGVNCSGSGALAVGRSFDDEGVRGGGQSVDGGLSEEGVGGHGQPLRRLPVGGDDGGLLAVAFDDEFVEVAGFGGIEWAQREVVDDQDFDGGQSPDFGVDGVVESGRSESGEQFVRSCEQDTVSTADGHVSQCCCQMRLADSDGSEDDRGLVSIEEA